MHWDLTLLSLLASAAAAAAAATTITIKQNRKKIEYY